MTNDGIELMDRAAAAETIRKLNEDDLRFLNRLIVDRLKLLQEARNSIMLASFSVGDRLRFPTSDGEVKSGVIIRLNKKTASICTEDGHHWNVHPAFLSANASAKPETRRIGSPGGANS
jgi:hypothetical protein